MSVVPIGLTVVQFNNYDIVLPKNNLPFLDMQDPFFRFYVTDTLTRATPYLLGTLLGMILLPALRKVPTHYANNPVALSLVQAHDSYKNRQIKGPGVRLPELDNEGQDKRPEESSQFQWWFDIPFFIIGAALMLTPVFLFRVYQKTSDKDTWSKGAQIAFVVGSQWLFLLGILVIGLPA